MQVGGIGLSPRERLLVLFLFLGIALTTAVGFFAFALIGRYYLVLAGLGGVAYVFGLRHGMDADHIAAIDNTTRKLMQDGKRPLAVGTWFSLGHSSVVVAMIVGLVLFTRIVVTSMPLLQNFGSLIGTAISGAFLWILGLVNVAIVIGIYRIFKEQREGRVDPNQLESLLASRGLMNRYFGGLFKVVQKPWQIYPVGVLFGLGFDTASEVALIAISVGVSVTSSVPLWMILLLPLMFTCGMVLVDSLDAVTMRVAYGWAFLKPHRKIYYNFTITLISVLVAFAVGSVEFIQVLSTEFGLSGWIWSAFDSVDYVTMGYGILAIFVISWVASIAFYKYKGFDRVGLAKSEPLLSMNPQ